MQKVFLAMCRDEPRIFFNSVAWTLDPRQPVGLRNLPFILRPKQEDALLKVDNCVSVGKDAVMDKSRDEGATEILMKFTANKFLLIPETIVLVGSRAEDLVDKTGDPSTLFAKIDYTINNLPIWWKLLLGWDGKNPVESGGFKFLERNFGHYKNYINASTTDGEATSIHFGAGKRTTFTIVDELGQVDPNVANSIVFNLSDVGNCNIYNSTHFYGTGHAFYKLLKRKGIEIIKLPWYDNPKKSQGIYASPKIDEIEIIDKEYYLSKYPDVFKDMDISVPFKYSEFSKKYEFPVFIADGCERPPIILRSPWHDKEEEERDFTNLCKNVWMYPTGASDMYFDSFVNDKIRTSFCRLPRFEGDITFEIGENGKVINPSFKRDYGKKRLKWWGELKEGRPIQSHNYIIACDIGFGTGASNSTAMIGDVNTNELIGEYVTAEHDPAEFSEIVSALARWVGGITNVPFLIWERNGGGGKNFGRRIMRQGFTYVYTDTAEDTKTHKRKNRYGWTSTSQTKDDVLSGLKFALKESLKSKKEHKYITIYSEEVVNELDSYIFLSSNDISASELIDLSSGARARHGDRVIGTALLVLGFKYQPKAITEVVRKPSKNSLAYRQQQWEREQEENKRKYRVYRY